MSFSYYLNFHIFFRILSIVTKVLFKTYMRRNGVETFIELICTDAQVGLLPEIKKKQKHNTGELGYDGPLYDGFLHKTDDMLGHSPMHIKYSSYVYDGFCI